LLSNVIQGEALLRVLVKKGLLNEEEVIDEVHKVKVEMMSRSQ